MYPKNAASPPRLSVGAIYQISDGAKQTTGASATVTPEGGAEGAAGGTLACLSTSGEWVYTPTQAETNYTAFIVAVYKASCTSASVTVVTTNSATPGTVDAVKIKNVDADTAIQNNVAAKTQPRIVA